MTQATQAVIDVRPMADCHERHSAIFGTFVRLASGDAMEIIVHHDPKPLRGKLGELYPDQFTWNYLEAGPTVWRVRIERV